MTVKKPVATATSAVRSDQAAVRGSHWRFMEPASIKRALVGIGLVTAMSSFMPLGRPFASPAFADHRPTRASGAQPAPVVPPGAQPVGTGPSKCWGAEIYDVATSAVPSRDIESSNSTYYMSGDWVDIALTISSCAAVTGVKIEGVDIPLFDLAGVDQSWSFYYKIIGDQSLPENRRQVTIRLHVPDAGLGIAYGEGTLDPVQIAIGGPLAGRVGGQAQLELALVKVRSVSPYCPTEGEVPKACIPVWRIQLRAETADVSNAGTEDAVMVRLNRHHRTWLDHARDDFARGDEWTYDLNLAGIEVLGDVYMLEMSKVGSDGWCAEELGLLVNGQTFHHVELGSASGTCRWLRNQNGYGNVQLIATPETLFNAMTSWVDQPRHLEVSSDGIEMRIPRDEMEERIEGMVGSSIHGTGLYWGLIYNGRAVEATRGGEHTLHVDLDLAYDANNWPNPEVDIDFDMLFSCNMTDGEVEMLVTMQNVQVNVDLLFESVVEWLEHEDSEETIASALPQFSQALPLALETCPSLTVEENGDVVISAPWSAVTP